MTTTKSLVADGEACEAALASLGEAVNNEEFDAATALVVRISELAPAFATAATTDEERAARWRLVLDALESARRSTIASRQHLRSQAIALKQTTAYNQGTLEREPRWSTAL
jgi:hypothetical protein